MPRIPTAEGLLRDTGLLPSCRHGELQLGGLEVKAVVVKGEKPVVAMICGGGASQTNQCEQKGCF